MRRRRQRAGERLRVDVALVLQRQPGARVLRPERMERDPRLDGHPAGRAIGVDHAPQPRGVDQQPVRAGDVGERVPAADGAHPQPRAAASATTCASSSSLVGRTISAGAQRWSPVQFFQTRSPPASAPAGPRAGLGDRHRAVYERLRTIFEGIEAPFAFVDLDALAANADSMLARAAGKPIRVASKSVRCREVLTLVDERDERFRGLLCFTVAEALMLAEAGRRDLVVAYPSVDRRAISRLAELAHADPEAAPVLMVDEAAQLDLIEGCVGGGPTPIPVAIDIDVGYRALRGALQAGPKRSPIRTAAAGAPVRRGDRLTTGAASSSG